MIIRIRGRNYVGRDLDEDRRDFLRLLRNWREEAILAGNHTLFEHYNRRILAEVDGREPL
jgi:hypothetical protein